MSNIDTKAIPFMRVIIPVMIGVVLGDIFDFSVWPLLSALAVSFVMGLALRHTVYGSVYLWVGTCLLYVLFATWAHPSTELPHNQRLTATAVVINNPVVSGRWGRCDASVTAFRFCNSDSLWHSINEKITISVDTSYRLSAGDKIAYTGFFNTIGDSSYGRLLARRGYTARSFLTPGKLIYDLPPEGFSAYRTLATIKNITSARLSRLGLGQNEEPVVQAMVLGRKNMISKELRNDYARSGAAQILAVSGLHVGIVFLFINAMLWFLPLFRHGHIAKNVIAIMAVWFYALLTGFSPSVIRAAFMFSGVQLALASSARAQSLNTLLATAAVMLAIWPNSLWDMSFQLSFMAVLFIMTWMGPLYRLVRTRWSVVNFIVGAFVISVVASIGTGPLVAFHFGYFSITGLVINPIVTTMAYGIIILPVIWIIAPLSFLGPLIHWPVEWAVRLQNHLAHWGSMQEWGMVYASPSLLWLAVIYGSLLLVTPWVQKLGEIRK